MSDLLKDALTAAQVTAGMEGRPPEPFRRGAVVELLMDNDRIVRGRVEKAGSAVAQLVIGIHPPWRDARNRVRPAYPLVNLIVYAQVKRWRFPKEGASHGTWMPGHPERKAALAQSGGRWTDWTWPR